MTENQRAFLSGWAAKRPHMWMGLMLITLHLALAWGIQAWWARGLMLTHFGFFLMWQPVWRADKEISAISAALIVAVGLTLGFVANWWLATVWLGVLIALIGGKAFSADTMRQRIPGFIALMYLLGMLLGWVVPQLFEDYQINGAVVWLMRFGWMVLPLILLLLPQEPPTDSATHVVDFIYSLMLFLLVMVLVLGGFALKLVTKGDYWWAMAQTLLGLAAVLLILAWLWKPRAGFSGFGQLLSRYLLSVGLPFEQWLQALAGLAEAEREPEVFLQKAMAELQRLPWVAGARWQIDHAGEFGVVTPHSVALTVDKLNLELFIRTRVSPSLIVHVRLLTELLAFFYEAKVREQRQRQNAYVQAIHETGARLTHDVKNLLQSLTALCSAAETADADQAEALQMLIRRQLPLITRRLDQTLKKLKAPHNVGREEVQAAEWWQNLRARYEPHGVMFEMQGAPGETLVPGELFDSVADNLLQNAIKKRGAEAGVIIRAQFMPTEGVLKIEDSGSAMAESVATKLFEAPVASNTGLGIGLYQAARQAQQLGYELRVANNEAGKVGFELRLGAVAQAALG